MKPLARIALIFLFCAPLSANALRPFRSRRDTIEISPHTCGNGTLERTEQCDDGNATAHDGCSAACTTESQWLQHPASQITSPIFFYDATYVAHMTQENSANTQITPSAADGDPIGQWADPVHGVLAQASADNRRPTLRSTGGISYVEWENDTAPQNLTLGTSKDLVNSFYEQGVGSITMLMRMRASQDGVLCYIADSGQNSSSNPGVQFRKEAANTLRVFVDSGAGATVFNATSTLTLTSALSWQIVHLSLNNASGGTICRGTLGNYAGRTCNTFARSAAPATQSGGTDQSLTIGALAGSPVTASTCDMDVRWITATAVDMSAADLQILWAYGPTARSSVSLLDCTLGYAAGYCNFLSHWYDLTDTTTLWQSRTARSTAVSANADPVGTIANKADSLNHALKDATSATDNTTRALYQIDGTGIDFDGVNDEYNFNQNQRGGGTTFVWLASCRDTTDGCNVISANSSALSLSGASYSGNSAANGVAYGGCIPGTGDCGTVDLGNPGSYNIIATSRDGSSFAHTARGLSNLTTFGSATLSTAFLLNRIGHAITSFPNWEMDGRLTEVLIVQAPLTAAQRLFVVSAMANHHPGLGL